jgi:hypothetical protein
MIKWPRSAILWAAAFFSGSLAASGQTFEPRQPRSDQATELAQSGLPSLVRPLETESLTARYAPIERRQRLRWFLTNTLGPRHLAGGAITSAFGTAVDRPKEYGPGWGGFGDRFGMRLTGASTGNAMEAGIGALWGEDPRYFRVPEKPFKARVRNVIRLTFVARRRDASFAPAYARFIGVTGNNFLSNTWRADSEANNHDAALRTLEGIAGRMAGNAFEEFWPDVESHVFHKKR